MLGMVLRDVALQHWLYFTAKPSHVGGRCEQASLPFVPSYSLQSSIKGIELPVKRCLVPSYGSRRWHLSEGCEAPGLGYFMEC
jgi:hypothetical protein